MLSCCSVSSLINGLARGITDAFTFGGIIFCCFLVPPGSLYVATKIKPIKINLTEYATIIVGRYLQFLPLETDPTNRSNAVLAPFPKVDLV